ncbi:membrane protein [Herbiconiux moechotypicola]|uniref:Membrane protein n=1 Tax=Herbiconiux moechotypicola TaxID=637393 RepID=A0ABN3D9C1_9MICO
MLRGPAGQVAAGSGLSAAVGFVVLIVAARSLAPAENTVFLTFWSMLLTGFGVLGGLSTEAIRSVSLAARGARSRHGGADVRRTSLLAAGAIWGAVLGGVVAVVCLLGREALLGADWPVLAAALVVAMVLGSGWAVVVGGLGGRGRWSVFAAMTGCDALLRLAVVAVLTSSGAGSTAMAIGVAVTPGIWVIALSASASVRRAARAEAPARLTQVLALDAHAIAAAASSAVLVAGLPLLIALTAGEGEGGVEGLGALMLAVTLVRAPLLVPLTAFQGLIVRRAALQPEGVERMLAWAGAGLAAVAVLGTGAAAAWGEGVLRWVSGVGVPGLALATLVPGAAALAGLTLTGALALARSRHRRATAGWLVAAVVTGGALCLPLPLELRVAGATFVGPVAGIVVHQVKWIRLHSAEH